MFHCLYSIYPAAGEEWNFGCVNSARKEDGPTDIITYHTKSEKNEHQWCKGYFIFIIIRVNEKSRQYVIKNITEGTVINANQAQQIVAIMK